MKWAQALLKSIDRNLDLLNKNSEKVYTEKDDKGAS
jgi:hypothetical protein